jgi:hypothetical protein
MRTILAGGPDVVIPFGCFDRLVARLTALFSARIGPGFVRPQLPWRKSSRHMT